MPALPALPALPVLPVLIVGTLRKGEITPNRDVKEVLLSTLVLLSGEGDASAMVRQRKTVIFQKLKAVVLPGIHLSSFVKIRTGEVVGSMAALAAREPMGVGYEDDLGSQSDYQ